MFNEIAAKRQRLLKKAYEYLKESQECIYDAMYDETDGAEMLSMELWTDRMSEILDDLVSYANDAVDDAELAEAFLYGRM